MSIISKVYNRIQHEDRKIKFILSKILFRSKLCILFKIKREKYRLQFSPTSFAWQLWYHGDKMLSDEVFIQDYLGPGDVFLDIGANIGTHSLLAAATVGKNGKVFAFEAHPRIFGFLLKNCAINGFDTITAYNFAIGNGNALLKLSDLSLDDRNSVIPSGKGITVIEKRLDEFDFPGTIDLMKIDVEGYEKFILLGGNRTLSKVNCIIYESANRLFRNYGYGSRDVIRLLEQQGFSLYGLKKFKKEIYSLPENYTSTTMENLLAIRNIQSFKKKTGYKIE